MKASPCHGVHLVTESYYEVRFLRASGVWGVEASELE
jgi:hypothetical protein